MIRTLSLFEDSVMKIRSSKEVEEVEVGMEGAKDVTKKVLIGMEEGSSNIIMRRFTVRPGGHTPRHQHNYEHLVRVEKGKGVVIDENGKEHEVTVGQNVFVEANKDHQFKNPYEEPFEFICVIPNPERIAHEPLSH